MIFVLSVQHTGTWATINYLQGHKEVDGLQQAWCFGCEHRTHNLRMGLNVKERIGSNMIVHDHVDASSYRFAPVIAHYFPVVFPVRDPLASLITKHTREPETYPHTAHLENWRLGVRLLERGIGHPITVDRSPEWERLSSHLGFEPTAPPGRVNTTSPAMLHQAYTEGDIKTLKKSLGDAWADLREKEPLLRPTLERLGYQNLMWWS